MLALAVVLLIIGLVFVVAEVFFVSMGLLSLLAIASILAADYIAFEHSTAAGWIFIGAEVILVPALIFAAFRLLPKLPFGRRMLLSGPATQPTGGLPEFALLVGHVGEALTDLRPSGTALFGEERISVVAVGPLIPRGAAVTVVAVTGPEVRVRPTHPLDPDDDEL